MKRFALLLVAALGLGAVASLGPVRAEQSNALCAGGSGTGSVDTSRSPVDDRFGQDVDYCFDGRRIHIHNGTAAVISLSFSTPVSDVRRDQSGGSAGSILVVGSAPLTVIPPGYGFSAAVGDSAVTITRTVDESRSQQRYAWDFWAGVFPRLSDAAGLVAFVDEAEDIAREYHDCDKSGFWGNVQCHGELVADYLWATGRLGLSLTGGVTKFKEIIDTLGDASVGADLGQYINDQLLLGPGTLTIPARQGTTGGAPASLPGAIPSFLEEVYLERGAARGSAYWYSVRAFGFTPNSSLTVVCHDSVDASFYSKTVPTDGNGEAFDPQVCYSADGPDHWVTVGEWESNHVTWSAGAAPQPTAANTPPPTPAPTTPATAAPTTPAAPAPTAQATQAPTPPPTTVPGPPTIASFDVGVNSQTVTMAGSIGWPSGTDPITCNFLVDGASVYNAQCGVQPSLTREYPPGTHTFQMEVCNRLGACVRSQSITRDVAAPAPPAPSPSVSLAQGPVAPQGYRYAVTLSGFPANTSVTVTCHDTVDPGGFFTFTLQTNGAGAASTSSQCYSMDGPEHWVIANGVQSNTVNW